MKAVFAFAALAIMASMASAQSTTNPNVGASGAWPPSTSAPPTTPPVPSPNCGGPGTACNPNVPNPTWPPESGLPPTTPSTGGAWPPPAGTISKSAKSCTTAYPCVITAQRCVHNTTVQSALPALGTISYLAVTTCPSGRSSRWIYNAPVEGTAIGSCIDLENHYLTLTPLCQ